MIALVRPHTPLTLDLSIPHSSVETIKTGAIVGLLVVQTDPISPTHIATKGRTPVSVFEEPVTWEDAEWQ